MLFLRNSCSPRKKRSKDTTAALTCCLAFHVVDFNRFANKTWKYRCDEKAHENLWSSLLALCRMQIDFYLGLLAFFTYQQSGNASVWISGFIARNIFLRCLRNCRKRDRFWSRLKGEFIGFVMANLRNVFESFANVWLCVLLRSRQHCTHSFKP